MTDRTLQTIDLAILAENLRAIRQAVPASARLLAVVKSDAYGHGAVQTAQTVLNAGADALAVAAAEEGMELRRAGITAPVLILGALIQGSEADCVSHGLTQAVCTPEMVRRLESAAAKLHQAVSVHLKLDTGMSRIGCRTPEEVRSVLAALEEAPHVRLTGAFTHFADADGDPDLFTGLQHQRFLALASLLPDGITLHCANSAAIHRYPGMAHDMVRAGISLYGYPPVETGVRLRPALRWTAQVTFIKEVDPGDTVSYGRIWTADSRRKIATVACGYGDGYHRAATGHAQVLIHGVRCPVVGRICMDQMMADVTAVPRVQAGDEAVLIGRSGQDEITAADVAAWAGTIPYEVLLAATGRVRRIWLPDQAEGAI